MDPIEQIERMRAKKKEIVFHVVEKIEDTISLINII